MIKIDFSNERVKANFKAFLFLLGIALIISGIWYSQNLVSVLEEKTAEAVNFRIKLLEQSLNNPNSNTDIDFLFNEVIQNADYPLIYTDTENNPRSWRNIDPEIDNKSLENFTHEDSLKLFSALEKIKSENPPIPIKYQNKIVLGYYYYGYPDVLYKLRRFPYLAILAALAFGMVGYVGFSYIKKSEQQFIWVGMAKETAHQLGTPLTSIAGWLELLKINDDIKEIAIEEIQKDLQRLNKVANRFSKIGSKPTVTPTDIAPVIQNVVEYFNRRLPNSQKKVKIETEFKDQKLIVNVNEDLFSWVLENLIKNAIDAMRPGSQGKIVISALKVVEKKELYIEVTDNGKGIPSNEKRKIFKPGYSTKKRGWGLGLSLAKRIIENYHGGRLILKESKINKGSTFRISLKLHA
ncbi:MAG: HAMP domain-containing histidine kinase [Caldisericaceae bacterium]|nr:HAMP domain-containing histidine kinase [Caldisericaceae bacterium]